MTENAHPLQRLHASFTKWLGHSYDLGAIEVAAAVAVGERLDGDPCWLIIISGSGNAKTETVMALTGAGALTTSKLTGEAALLSATPKKERASTASGGLLRRIGPRGILVLKDFTSVLTMNKDARNDVLGALREVYDGKWDREVGSDGGSLLTWEGRIVVVAACTSAYDAAHSVIASMGDRFALYRMDSSAGVIRLAAGRQALRNVGQEIEMRAELADAAGEFIDSMDPALAVLQPDDMQTLLGVANLVTLGRTAVERDYRGDVIAANAPEMPTRFAKMLGQIMRGALALHMDRDHAMSLAVHVAGDSMPPIRLELLNDVWHNPGSKCTDVAKRIQKPRTTVDRELQALHLIGLLRVEEPGGAWLYWLSDEADEVMLERLITRNVRRGVEDEALPSTGLGVTTNISGDDPGASGGQVFEGGFGEMWPDGWDQHEPRDEAA